MIPASASCMRLMQEAAVSPACSEAVDAICTTRAVYTQAVKGAELDWA